MRNWFALVWLMVEKRKIRPKVRDSHLRVSCCWVMTIVIVFIRNLWLVFCSTLNNSISLKAHTKTQVFSFWMFFLPMINTVDLEFWRNISFSWPCSFVSVLIIESQELHEVMTHQQNVSWEWYFSLCVKFKTHARKNLSFS